MYFILSLRFLRPLSFLLRACMADEIVAMVIFFGDQGFKCCYQKKGTNFIISNRAFSTCVPNPIPNSGQRKVLRRCAINFTPPFLVLPYYRALPHHKPYK